MPQSPEHLIAVSFLISHVERSVERLLMVVIAGWSVWLSFSLARRNAEALRSGKVEVDAAKWKVMVGSLAVPVAVLPMAAACAFVGLGLTPVETTWPLGTAAGSVQGSATSRDFGGNAAVQAGDPRDRWALEGVVRAFRQQEALEAAAKGTDGERMAERTRLALSRAEIVLVGDVFGTGAQACIAANVSVRATGGDRKLDACDDPDPVVRAAATDAATVLGGQRP